MNYLEKFFDGVHYVFNLNAATLSGAIDIIVVEQEDGTLKCTPFHVRFGKLHLLNSREKVVSVTVNGKPASFGMKLGNAGEAFFVEETDEPVPSFLATSPMSSPTTSRRNSRQFDGPGLAFASTEELVPELVGPRRIITTTKTTKTTKTTPAPTSSSSSTAATTTTTTTTTTKTIEVAKPVVAEELPLTSALEALIESERLDVEGNYSSDSELMPKDSIMNGNAGNAPPDLPAAGSSFLEYDSPVGSPKEDMEYAPSGADDESGAAWRLAWGWGGLPKITRRSKTTKTTEYVVDPAASPLPVRPYTPINSSGSDTSPNSGGPNIGPNSDIIPAPSTPPLATPNRKAMGADDAIGRNPRELQRQGSSWTRSIIRYFKPTDANAKPEASPNGENDKPKKKIKEENVTVDGGIFMMDTVATIRSSTGTASELTDTTTGSDSDSDEEEEGEEEREFMDAQSELVVRPDDLPNGDLPSSPETDDAYVTPLLSSKNTANFPSDAVAVSILDLEAEDERTRAAQRRIIERHGSISYETTLLVGDSEDTLRIPVTVTAPHKITPPPTVSETQITILDTTPPSNTSSVPIISSPSHFSTVSEDSDSSPVPSRPPFSSSPSTTQRSSAPSSLASSLDVVSTSPTPSRPLLTSASVAPPASSSSSTSSVLPTSSSSLPPASPSLRSSSPPPSSPAPLRSSAPSILPKSSPSASPSTSRPSSPVPEGKEKKSLEKGEEKSKAGEEEKKEKDASKDKVALMSPLDVGNLKVEISLCASQLAALANNKELIDATFAKFKVSYDDLSNNPALLSNQDLVFRFNDRLYPWSIAAPYLISVLVFHQPLKPSALEALTKAQEKSKRSSWGYFWPFRSQPKGSTMTDPEQQPSSRPSSPPARMDSQKIQELKQELQQQLPAVQQGDPSAVPAAEAVNRGEAGEQEEDDEKPKKYSKKTLRPTAEQLKSLGLQPGANVITFSVTSTLQGTREVTARMFLWDTSAKIVVSDIDGTITKSDVFGQIAPIIGRDWTHAGVAQLYSNIAKNGYRIIYLTSRAIGQAGLTRGFITSVKQGEAGGLFLPEGPIMLSPNRLLASINREVIRRNPEEFKIACLKDIKALFPAGQANFYAGFGNRITDAYAYGAVGIPKGRVFTINPMGIIINFNATYKKSYHKLNEVVWEMFPPLHLGKKNYLDEKYNDFNYWKHQSGNHPVKFDF